MICFKPIERQEIQHTFPHLYRQDAQYEVLLKKGERAGLYGMIDRGRQRAEVFVTVFDGYKYKVLQKSSLFYMIHRPLFIGFNEVWTWTRWQSWIKLLRKFEKEGVEPQLLPPFWDNDITKIWFRKRAS
jgi:hypothetical protein